MRKGPLAQRMAAWAVPFLFSLLILLPHFASPPTWDGQTASFERWAWPLVHKGDEPHYLVAAHSLFRDGDLDLANNYAAAHAGDSQAGRALAGEPMGHHSVYYVDGEYTLWWGIYRLRRPAPGAPWRIVPVSPLHERVAAMPEYSLHPPGLAIVLATVFRPFGNADLLEPGGILLSGVMVIVAMLGFRQILGRLGARPLVRELATAVVFFGTPIWHYGRTLYTESFTLCLAVSAFALYLARSKHIASGALLPGLLLGLAILLRPVSVLFCVPFGIELLVRRRYAELASMALAPVLAVATILFLNDMMFGSPFRTAQPAAFGNPLVGLFGLTFSLDHGLVLFAPAVLVAAVAWPAFLRAEPRAARLALGMALPSLALVACWHWWDGGFVYGPRLIVPLIPFLFLSLARIEDVVILREPAARALAALICILSIVVNFMGATNHTRHLDAHPFRDAFAERTDRLDVARLPACEPSRG